MIIFTADQQNTKESKQKGPIFFNYKPCPVLSTNTSLLNLSVKESVMRKTTEVLLLMMISFQCNSDCMKIIKTLKMVLFLVWAYSFISAACPEIFLILATFIVWHFCRPCVTFHNILFFYGGKLLAPHPPPRWRTTPCQLPTTGCSIHSQLPSMLFCMSVKPGLSC
jgi:hypothetical protein